MQSICVYGERERERVKDDRKTIPTQKDNIKRARLVQIYKEKYCRKGKTPKEIYVYRHHPGLSSYKMPNKAIFCAGKPPHRHPQPTQGCSFIETSICP